MALGKRRGGTTGGRPSIRNAAMERFFWSLKHEWTNDQFFDDLEGAQLSVFKYIETFYNPVRIHQALGYLSPDQYEAENAPALAA